MRGNDLHMNKQTIVCVLTAIAVFLTQHPAHARYLSTDTGRFMTMDTYAGNTHDPVSLHKYLYTEDNPVNRVDPTGHAETADVGLAGGLGIGIEAWTLAGINAARIWSIARIGIIAGTVAATVTSDTSKTRSNPYVMTLQLQEGTDLHYWSTAIFGTRIPGSTPPKYNPVTKRQVQEQLGVMFTAIQTGNYVLKHNWDAYKLGGDESLLWSAIIRMSEFVQTHGPTQPEPYIFHQEYYDPNNFDSPRIDLNNVVGINLGQ
jgi:RHS repeat-associated protein